MAWALAPLAAVPAVVAWPLGERGLALAQAGAAAGFVLLGILLRRLAPRHGAPGASGAPMPAPEINEAMVLAALGFLLPGLILGGTLTATGLPLDGALFEGISGITTTGLSALPAAETLSWPVLFTRAWLQWFGGLGVVVLAVALVVGREAATARALAETQSIAEDLASSLRERARRSLIVYAALSTACVLATWAAGASLPDALLFSMTAVSTAGFAPYTESMAALPGWAPGAVLMVFALAGATSFSVYLQLARGESLRAASRTEAKALLALTAAAIAALGLALLVGGMPWRQVLIHAPLMAVSAQTTTGLSSIDVAALPPAAWVVLMAAMAMGGNTGSTAGGLKTLRVLLIGRLLSLTLTRTAMPPNAVPRLRLFGETAGPGDVENVATLFILAVLTVALSWVPFLIAGYGLDALFEVISAVATTGLSTGVAGPGLSWPLKAVLMADMILGRLEFVAVIVLLVPATWIGPRHVT